MFLMQCLYLQIWTVFKWLAVLHRVYESKCVSLHRELAKYFCIRLLSRNRHNVTSPQVLCCFPHVGMLGAKFMEICTENI